MVVVGKTHTVEFAYGGWGTNQYLGTPHNPWDAADARTPGGSSSGSGVAHARNAMGTPGTRNPPPAYHPRVAARAILHACETPVRDLYVGTAGWLTSLAGALAPRLTDYVMEVVAKPTQATDDPGRAERRDNLYEPKEDLSERSSLGGPRPRGRSLLLDAQMNPGKTAAVVAGLAVAALGAALAGAGAPASARRLGHGRRW